MNWKEFIKPSLHDIRIVESCNIEIKAIECKGLFLIVYEDKFCNVFSKQYIESNRYILREQMAFELMHHYRKTAELILKKNYR